MTLEDWNTFFQFASVVLLALTFAVGAGAVATGYVLGRRHTERIAATGRDAAEANKKAAEAGEGTAIALADAAAANERAGKLELEAAQQREKAAKAERELVELQQRVAPRRYTAAQRQALVDSLTRSNPKGPVTIHCVLGDGEGFAFATQLDEILKAAGWPTNGVGQGAYTGGNPVGFGLVVRSRATAPPYAVVLLNAFKAAGVPLPGAESAQLDPGIVQLLVGNKPQ